MDIEENLFECDETEENNEPQTDDEQSSYEDSVKHPSPLKSIDVDETFAVFSVIGKSISHEETLTLLLLFWGLVLLQGWEQTLMADLLTRQWCFVLHSMSALLW